MKALKATYDGSQFLLDEPIDIPANSQAIIIVLSSEDEDWYQLARNSLSRAYSENEPEYSMSQLKESNSTYEDR